MCIGNYIQFTTKHSPGDKEIRRCRSQKLPHCQAFYCAHNQITANLTLAVYKSELHLSTQTLLIKYVRGNRTTRIQIQA